MRFSIFTNPILFALLFTVVVGAPIHYASENVRNRNRNPNLVPRSLDIPHANRLQSHHVRRDAFSAEDVNVISKKLEGLAEHLEAKGGDGSLSSKAAAKLKNMAASIDRLHKSIIKLGPKFKPLAKVDERPGSIQRKLIKSFLQPSGVP
ncbi:hypothetical protein FRB97_003700 [Tulasnella sp. 331]|nr:hypothetical protein FRB97_003700 [Tulasnella sp. 331]